MAANVQLSGSAADITAFQPPESGVVITSAVDSSGKQDIGRQMLMDDDDLIAFARKFVPLPTAFVSSSRHMLPQRPQMHHTACLSIHLKCGLRK